METGLDIALLRMVYDTCVDGIIVVDVETRQIRDANPVACEMYGYTLEEFQRLNVEDVTAEPEATRENFETARRWVPLRYQLRKDGSRFPVEIAASQFEHEGRAVRVAFIRDIASRLESESVLQASEAKYASAFKTSPDAVNLNRVSDGLYLEINDGFTALTGYTAEDVRGKTSTELSIWADPEDRVRLVSELRERGSVENFDAMFRTKDGLLVHALMSATVLTMDGEPCILSVTRDITEREVARAALEASEAKFATAFRTSPDSVNITTVAEGRYLDVNEGFCALTGYTPEEVVGKTVKDISIWADPKDRDTLVTALRARGRLDGLLAGFRRKDGSVLYASMSARPIEIDGVACILSVTRDMTDRIEAERALQGSYERLELMVKDVAEAMGRIVESRDPYTQGHQERVSALCGLIAREMGLADDDIAAVEMAALVHDVGKLAVPAEILNKPGRLSPIEFGLIKVHSEKGYDILRDIDFGAPIAQIVLQHHERMDGSGYPEGLAGEAILPSARILCVADVVEAMASYRPYRPALGIEPAIEEITGHPTKYDAAVVSACLALNERGELGFLATAR